MFSALTSKFVHEMSKTIAKRVPLSKKKLATQNCIKREILNMNGLCEYCEVNPVRRGGGNSGDHFKPLVYNKMPSEYCHEPINLIPVCSTCNCSKQSRDFFEWYGNATYCKGFPAATRRRVIKKMKQYATAFEQHHTIKKVPKGEVRKVLKTLEKHFKTIQHDMDTLTKKTVFTKKRIRLQ